VFYPFFLEGVALDAKLNQDDGMHPNGKGVGEIVKRIMPSVEELIGRASPQQRAAAPKT
jgi:acyl-CoA thioesterase-1